MYTCISIYGADGVQHRRHYLQAAHAHHHPLQPCRNVWTFLSIYLSILIYTMCIYLYLYMVQMVSNSVHTFPK